MKLLGWHPKWQPEQDQLMGRQVEGREWGPGDKGRRGEQCCARSLSVSRLPHGACRMVPATFPLFKERLENCSALVQWWLSQNGQAISCCLAARGFGHATQIIQFASAYPYINSFSEAVPAKNSLFAYLFAVSPVSPLPLSVDAAFTFAPKC